MSQSPDPDTDPESVGPRGVQRYESRASEYLGDPAKARGLLDSAQSKAGRTNALTAIWDDFTIVTRLVRAYVDGSYRKIPWGAVLTATAAIVYFVTPTDFIPDFILGLGLVDDAAVLAWAAKMIGRSLADFRAWENAPSESGGAG